MPTHFQCSKLLKRISESRRTIFHSVERNGTEPVFEAGWDHPGKGGESIRRDLHFSPTRIKLKETRMEAKVKKCDSRWNFFSSSFQRKKKKGLRRNFVSGIRRKIIFKQTWNHFGHRLIETDKMFGEEKGGSSLNKFLFWPGLRF